jgi:hypothetical protein
MQNNEEPSPTEKRELLTNWAVMIKNECDTYSAELDKKMADYNERKSTYDRILSKKLKWINSVERRIIKRRKQLEEVEEEIKKLNENA